MYCSHPFQACPSQSWYPAWLQLTTVQAPAMQAKVADQWSHATPHEPQFIVVLRSVSHPSVGSWLQSPNPGAQEKDRSGESIVRSAGSIARSGSASTVKGSEASP